MFLQVYHIPIIYCRKLSEYPNEHRKLQLFPFAFLSSSKMQISFKMIHRLTALINLLITVKKKAGLVKHLH